MQLTVDSESNIMSTMSVLDTSEKFNFDEDGNNDVLPKMISNGHLELESEKENGHSLDKISEKKNAIDNLANEVETGNTIAVNEIIPENEANAMTILTESLNNISKEIIAKVDNVDNDIINNVINETKILDEIEPNLNTEIDTIINNNVDEKNEDSTEIDKPITEEIFKDVESNTASEEKDSVLETGISAECGSKSETFELNLDISSPTKSVENESDLGNDETEGLMEPLTYDTSEAVALEVDLLLEKENDINISEKDINVDENDVITSLKPPDSSIETTDQVSEEMLKEDSCSDLQSQELIKTPLNQMVFIDDVNTNLNVDLDDSSKKDEDEKCQSDVQIAEASSSVVIDEKVENANDDAKADDIEIIETPCPIISLTDESQEPLLTNSVHSEIVTSNTNLCISRPLEVEPMDIDEIKEKLSSIDTVCTDTSDKEESSPSVTDVEPDVTVTEITTKKMYTKSSLSNTLDILSDDEDEQVADETIVEKKEHVVELLVEDDDDVMLVDSLDKLKNAEPESAVDKDEPISTSEDKTPELEPVSEDAKEEKVENVIEEEKKADIPLLRPDFANVLKSKVSNMTKEELEEFCLVKIVEGIVDRASLSDTKTKLKAMTSHIDEWRKKVMMLTKQNTDLKVVLSAIQEEQKKAGHVIRPLKITRSVGLQVGETKTGQAMQKVSKVIRKPPQKQKAPMPPTKQKPEVIPVPRLVPAAQPAKVNKTPPPATPQPVTKSPSKTDKRSFSSVTVDLTDDEPPNKILAKQLSAPVRVVAPQTLYNRPPIAQALNPRKVFIPITGQNHPMRPALMLKTVTAGNRARAPTTINVRMPQSPQIRTFVRPQIQRHPAPLPDAHKQPTPANWKSLPPAPDLKIAKVENGIVISWKIEGYPSDVYEEIASYQLFAYQETSAPPTTLQWKKIGDVKALPLPMACTLTQFMAGFKYYFAVRAIDIKSRIGPFSLPGSILLISK